MSLPYGRALRAFLLHGVVLLAILAIKSLAQPSYSLDASAFVPDPIAPGSGALSRITITPSNGYNYSGAFSLSCTVRGLATPVPICIAVPPLLSNGSGTTIVAIGTSRMTGAGDYQVSITGADMSGLGPTNGTQFLPLRVQLVKPSDVFVDNSAVNGNKRVPNPDPNLIAGGSVVANDVILRGWLRRLDPCASEPNSFSCIPITPMTQCTPPTTVTTLCAVEINKQRSDVFYIGYEDVHYNILLDADFITDTYGVNTSVLSGAWLPGNPIDGSTTSFPLHDTRLNQPVTFNSFWLLYGPTADIHSELNAWHQLSSTGCGNGVVCKEYLGRGFAPAGWQEKEYSPITSSASDNWWPFDPDNPENLRSQGKPIYLAPGDYVELRGTLFEDSGPGHGEQGCWEKLYHNHSGWLEIHPVDGIRRLYPFPRRPSPEEQPVASAQAGVTRAVPILTCADPPTTSTSVFTVCPENQYSSANPTRDSGPYPLLPFVTEFIDHRFTDMSGITITPTKSPTPSLRDCVQIVEKLTATPGIASQHFKGTYLVSWSPINSAPPAPILTDSDIYFLSPPPFACPRNVTIADQDRNALIYYTTDGSNPTTNSKVYGGVPIPVISDETIEAFAVNNTGQSNITRVHYECAPYDYIDIDITTGNDDARSDSEVDATLNASGTKPLSWTWTLKPQNGPDPCDTSQNAWNNWTRCHQIFSIAPGVRTFSQFQSITITLGEHPGWFEGWDNWDIQGITVTAYANGKPKVLLDLSNPRDQTNPNNCYTRLKHGPGMNTVNYVFGANNPSDGCPQ